MATSPHLHWLSPAPRFLNCPTRRLENGKALPYGGAKRFRSHNLSNPRLPWKAPPHQETLSNLMFCPVLCCFSSQQKQSPPWGFPYQGISCVGLLYSVTLWYLFLGTQMPGYFPHQSCNPHIKKPGPISRRIKKTALSQYLLKCRFFQSRSAEFCNNGSQEALLQEGTVS